MLVARPEFFYPGQTLDPVVDSLAARVLSPNLALIIILAIALLKKDARLLSVLFIGLLVNEALDAYLAIYDWQQGLSFQPVQRAFGPALFSALYLIAFFRLKKTISE